MNRALVCCPKYVDRDAMMRRLFPNANFGHKLTENESIIENVQISTKYYQALITVFIDEIESDELRNFSQWIEELCETEMRELRDELQLIVLVNVKEDDIETSTIRLNAVLNTEYCELHAEAFQWDGEIVVTQLEEEASTNSAIELIECVKWRDVKVPEPVHLSTLPDFEHDLKLLRQMRDSHEKDTELTQIEHAAVQRILDNLQL